MNILGISAFYHDSAACLISNGEIHAAAQEERFTRKKHDARFPRHAIDYCLQQASQPQGKQLDLVAFYEKPFLKWDRLLSTYLAVAPSGVRSFVKAMPVWIKQKIWIKELIRKELGFDGPIIFPEHHESHAASAFFPSPFEEAAILTIDGVGEWTTTSVGRGKGNRVELIADLHFPHSLGLLYSAFTYYLGFRVNSGEYKVMGLAPYGDPVFREAILRELLDLRDDGSFRLNLSYFNFMAGLTMTSPAFHQLFGGPPRQPEAELTQRHMDVARSIQAVTEEVMLRLGRYACDLAQSRHLCLAGGVALNCVGNGRLLREGPFEEIWIQPAAGDAGGALGAALLGWYHYSNQTRPARPKGNVQHGSFLGPEYDAREFLNGAGIPHVELGEDDLLARVAQLLDEGKVIGWFQGRMEFGPRALGNRSILGDARLPTMQETLNLKIKFRESFRPFAPSVLRERVADYFELDKPSPYMLLVAPIKRSLRQHAEDALPDGDFRRRLRAPRSSLPAITHVDYSARIQTVAAEDNLKFHRLLSAFERQTNCPVLVNTSFNVRGEPPVCTPGDAFRCFMRTEMDFLVLGNFLLDKAEQGRSNFPLEPVKDVADDNEFASPDQSPASLRRFGFTLGSAAALLGAVLVWRQRGAGWPLISIGGILFLTAVLAPSTLRWLYRPWILLSLALGWLVSRLLLTIIFFVVITPLGWLQRILGKRQIEIAFRTDAASYWQSRTVQPMPADYEKQF